MEDTYPALKDGSITRLELIARLAVISSYFSRAPSYWTKIHSILVLLTDLLQENIWEVALPDDHGTITKWDCVERKWVLPSLQSVLRQTRRTQFRELYIEAQTDAPKQITTTWETLCALWADVTTFYVHYWYLHPNLNKEEAFNKVQYTVFLHGIPTRNPYQRGYPHGTPLTLHTGALVDPANHDHSC
jgi:hypothetical protein